MDNLISPKTQAVMASLWRLEKIILDTLDFNTVVQRIVDGLFLELGYLNLGYGIVVLALFDEEEKALKRISISQTEQATQALNMLPIPFHAIDIPISAENNFCVKAIKERVPQITHDWNDLLTPTYTPEDARKVQQAIGIKTSLIYPIVYRDKSRGVLIFSLMKDEAEVSEEEKELIRGFTDIVGIAVQNARLYSKIEKTRKELDQVNKKLQELDKLKDEFVSVAAHELRTPMAAIKGSVSTILEGYAGPISDQAREFLTAAYNENDRLIRVVNNLLNTSRIESGKLSFTIDRLDITKLITEVVRNLQVGAKEKNIYLTYDPPGFLPHVLADDDKIREILINLIGNAIKFTSEGGVSVRSKLEGDYVIVSVQDTGTGIHKEHFDLLFKKYSQLKTDYTKTIGGTGLGLYICKKIIEGLGGEIWLESEVGKGSVFYFSLPIAK
jgi:signal transduction histidine kinase